MRFCYLRIALLTSAFASNAFADTAETDGEVAASRTASSPPFVHVNSTASAVTETQEPTSVDDEDRRDLTVSGFAKLIGRKRNIKALKDMNPDQFHQWMVQNTMTKAVYHDLGLNKPKGNVLADKNWIRWAYFVCQLGHQFGENKYKFMITAMSVIYDAKALSKILITAAKFKKTKPLAINLLKFADDHIREQVLEKSFVLSRELSHQGQLTAKKIDETLPRARVMAYLEKHVRFKMLPSKTFTILTSYLSVLLSKDYAVSAGVSVIHKCSNDAILLQALLELNNFHDQQCLDHLLSIWLDVSLPPSKIVSMLVQDKAKSDQFTVLFSNGPSKNFWLHYLIKYNAISRNEEFTSFADSNLNQLLQMLFTVVEQESPATDKSMAYTTILKMLISPSTAHFSSSHENVMKLSSILLRERILPSDVLSMLMRGEAGAEKFKIYFVYQSSKSFWVRYLKMYIQSSVDVVNFTHTANIDFQQLLTMLRDVEEQHMSLADRFLASSTILKILLSPEIADVITYQAYLKDMTSVWLTQRLPPSAVVIMLVLEEDETDYFRVLFTNEQSSKLWEGYARAYYSNPSPQQNYLFPGLTDILDGTNLKRFLEAALKVEAVSGKAKFLLTQLS